MRVVQIPKRAGSPVIAGSISLDGALLIKSSGAGSATRWAKICRSVREALSHRSAIAARCRQRRWRLCAFRCSPWSADGRLLVSIEWRSTGPCSSGSRCWWSPVPARLVSPHRSRPHSGLGGWRIAVALSVIRHVGGSCRHEGSRLRQDRHVDVAADRGSSASKATGSDRRAAPDAPASSATPSMPWRAPSLW